MTDTTHTCDEAWRLLCRLCAVPRVSRDEAAAANLLELHMRHLGLRPHRHGHNLWCVCDGYDASRRTLLLNAHIDTVKPSSNQAYSVDAERLVARGANDDGASLVALLYVFATLPPQKYNLVFLASAEEEVSGRGGVETVLPLLPRIDVGLVGEPTQMQPAIAEKGLMVIDAVAHGTAGHAARDEGDNAIYRAMRDIATLTLNSDFELDSDFDSSHKSHLFPKVSPMLGPVKTTVTVMHAGTQHNVVPDRCEFTIDVRSNELYANEEIISVLRASLESELTPRSTRLHSSGIDPMHPLVQRAVALGRVPFGSSTLSDQALMPFPTMKMGPGDSRRSHTADEYVLRSELEEGVAIYVRLLDGLSI